MLAVTAAVLALGTLLVVTSTAAAGGTPGCPPPSAQLAAVQPGEFDCAAPYEPHLANLTPTTVGEPLDTQVVETPTGTTTLPAAAP